MGPGGADRCCLVAAPPHPSSMAGAALCRQIPKVGAECPNRARSDLCGGCSATGLLTAISSMAVRPLPLIYIHVLPTIRIEQRRHGCGIVTRRYGDSSE